MRLLALSGLVLAWTLSLAAEERQPWQFSAEERLTLRFDPSKIKERKERYRSDHRLSVRDSVTGNNASDPVSPQAYVIDGRRDPHLFLPHELFDHLLSSFHPDATLATRQRDLYGREIRAMGFDDVEFFRRLHGAAAPYLEVRERNGSPTSRSRCRARREALDAARSAVRDLDVILYLAVAPHSQLASSTGEAARLRDAESGCQ
ncbi:MAG TPA: hypothetical protein VNI54_04190 [Thermoanaerobaculia bacterium]|nr:hypothetical protein [Thermoanaerobaculia bacterium]